MEAPVYEKGYPSYEAVNRVELSDNDMVTKLHSIAQTVESFGACNLSAHEMRQISNRFEQLVKALG